MKFKYFVINIKLPALKHLKCKHDHVPGEYFSFSTNHLVQISWMVVLRNQIGHKQLFQFFLDRKDFRIILWPVPRELGMPLRELRQEFFHLVKTQHMVPLQDCTFFFNVMIQMILVLCQVNQILWFLARYIYYNVWGCTFLMHEHLMLCQYWLDL